MLTAGARVAVDGEYTPIADFSSWPQLATSASWEGFLRLLDEQRAAATEESLKAAADLAVRSAAMETGAIEGLYISNRGVTQTVAIQAAAWEVTLDQIGPQVRAHFDAQLRALEHVLETAASGQPITQVWVRELHAVICASQATYRVQTSVGWQDHPLPLGEYKTRQNHVETADGSVHYYCAVDDVTAEMQKIVDNMASEAFTAAPAVAQAAWAHHAFTGIHPFADGNGRVARALASAFLYRSVRLPLVVFADQKERYFDALVSADEGRPVQFLEFIEDRTLDTMALITSTLRKATKPPGSIGAQLKALSVAHGGLSFAEVQTVGQRLTELVKSALSRAHERLERGQVESRFEVKGGKFACDFSRPYHTLDDGSGFAFDMTCAHPVRVGVQVTPIIGVADSPLERYAYIAIDANRPLGEPLLLRVDDLHPAVTQSAQTRIDDWATMVHERAAGEMRDGVLQQLRQRGFTP